MFPNNENGRWTTPWTISEVYTENTWRRQWLRWYQEEAHCERCKPHEFPVGGPVLKEHIIVAEGWEGE